MGEDNVDRARRGYEAALRGDLDTIADLLDEEVKWHGGDPSAVGACRNRQQALEFMRQAQRDRPVGELVDVLAAGDKVVVIIRPPPRDGKSPALTANLTTFRDGKVVEMVHYPDPGAALRAAGLIRPG